MEIYSEAMQRLEDPDLSLGWLEAAVRRQKHEAVEGIEEQWHYETVAEYENGGRDVQKVIDVAGVEAKEAWEEEIPIRIYHPFSKEEIDAMQSQADRPTLERRIELLEAMVSQLQEEVRAALEGAAQKEE